MNARIIKEVRGLLPALGIALLLVFVVPFRAFLFGMPNDSHGGDISLLRTYVLSSVGPIFVIGAFCVVASASFSTEFQWRTLSLLLAQPISRWRIWWEKQVVALAAISCSMALLFVLAASADQLSAHATGSDFVYDALLWFLLVLPIICSAAFWSLLARTLTGAVVLNLGAQCLFVLLVDYFIKLTGTRTSLLLSERSAELHSGLGILAVASMVYAAMMLWLGWRAFRKLQLVEAVSGESRTKLENGPEKGVTETFSRGAGVARRILYRNWLLSFVLKELRMQRPTLLLATMYTVLWLTFVYLFKSMPERRASLNLYLTFLAMLYVPVSIILAGCVSVADEARLGVFEWHLTLPVSRRTIWFFKLVVAVSMALLAGVVLPIGLAYGTYEPFWDSISGGGTRPGDVLPLFMFAAAVFIISFWSACLLRDVIRGALAAVTISAIAYVACFFAANAAPDSVIQSDLVTRLGAELQWSPMLLHWRCFNFAWIGWTGTVVALLARQSFNALKRNRGGTWTVMRNAAIVLPVMAALTFWAFDLERSSRPVLRPVNEELWTASHAYLQKHPDAWKGGQISLADLDAAAPLSKTTQRLLRNADFEFRILNGKDQWMSLEVKWPNGQSMQVFGYWLSKDNANANWQYESR